MSYRKHLMTSDEPPSELYKAAEVGTNLAEVGADCSEFPNNSDTISREAVADAINGIECTRHTTWYEFYQKVMTAVEKLPPAEPKRETATVSVGKSKGGVTMWYECAACGEPVDQGDTFCSGCGRRLIHE